MTITNYLMVSICNDTSHFAIDSVTSSDESQCREKHNHGKVKVDLSHKMYGHTLTLLWSVRQCHISTFGLIAVLVVFF
jgi:hypothetical protein